MHHPFSISSQSLADYLSSFYNLIFLPQLRRGLMSMKYELKSLSVASEQVRLQWVLGGISELTDIPKKHWRKAFKIVTTPKMKCPIMKNGETVEKTFSYGFMSYIIKPKKKSRKILEPHPDVQKVYRGIKVWLEKVAPSHERIFGFVRNRNSKKATEILMALFEEDGHHFSFDIANAFPSITDKMVKNALIAELGLEISLAEVIAWFVTYKYQGKRRLPQGSSCSPLFLNLVYKPMLDDLEKICQDNDIVWSVYVDDFNFASSSISAKVKKELLAVPTKHGFKVHPKKIKDNFGKTIPHLLGLTIVDGKIHISRKQKKKFRQIIYLATKYDAYAPFSDEVVRGVLGYIKHIYGERKNWPGWVVRIGGRNESRTIKNDSASGDRI